MRPTIDDRDRQIFAELGAALMKNRINCGDFITFADGVTRRVSYIWTDEHGDFLPGAIQTSAGGSYHLAGDAEHSFVSFSGSLFWGVPFESLTDTGDTFDGDCWIFHHGFAGAHRDVHSTVKFRVWRCSLPSERC